MDSNILNAIYDVYVDNVFEGIQALNFDDLKDAYASLDEFMKKNNLSLSERNSLEANIISTISYTSEQKGFANGFKLAVRLIFETYGITK